MAVSRDQRVSETRGDSLVCAADQKLRCLQRATSPKPTAETTVRCVLHGSGKSPEQRETEGQDRGAELSIRSTGMQLMQVTVAPS